MRSWLCIDAMLPRPTIAGAVAIFDVIVVGGWLRRRPRRWMTAGRRAKIFSSQLAPENGIKNDSSFSAVDEANAASSTLLLGTAT